MHSFFHSFFLTPHSRNSGEFLSCSCKKKGFPFHIPLIPRYFSRNSFLRECISCKNKFLFTASHQNATIPLYLIWQQRILCCAVSLSPLVCRPLRLANSLSQRPRLLSHHRAPLFLLVVVLPDGLPPPLSRHLHL